MRLAMFLFCITCPWIQGQVPQIDENLVVYQDEDFRMLEAGDSAVLVYDRTFFARFEPVSVGDILKRLPGISGSADAGEFDHPQLRGLPPSHTRVLINGRPLPDSDNRSTRVDWIPADAVERVEIIRSPTSDLDAEGPAGVINIVLRDGRHMPIRTLTGNLVHTQPDDKSRAHASFTYATHKDQTSFSVLGALQRRRNPKSQKTSISDFAAEEEVFKDETNLLDADELHLNLSAKHSFASGLVISANAFVHDTERREDELALFTIDGELDATEFDLALIDQQRFGTQVAVAHTANSGQWQASLSQDRMDLSRQSEIGERDEEHDRLITEREFEDTQDRVSKFSLRWSNPIGPHLLTAGIDLNERKRDAGLIGHTLDEDEIEVDDSGVFVLRERRRDAYIADSWSGAQSSLRIGLRAEYTQLRQNELPSRSRTEFYPSIHVQRKLGTRWSIHTNLARTTRRPNFQDLTPHPRRNQPRDEDVTVGNPDLKAEQANGIDLGFDHKFQHGTMGVNFFYRHIDNLIEVTQIDEQLFQPQNRDHGKLWGIEFDLGTPLHVFHAPNLSVFANISLQDSSVSDPITGKKRRFNLQSEYVANAGFLQVFPQTQFSLGMNYLTQGNSLDQEALEVSDVQYGDDLEAVFEKRWGQRWTLRFSAKNLLDADRSETTRIYDGLREVSEIEQIAVESERTGRYYMLTFRATF